MKDSELKRRIIPMYEWCYGAVHDLTHWVNLRMRYRLRIMNSMRTIEYIRKNHCSIARYGDGELSFALKIDHEIAFQNNSEELSEALEKVLRNRNPKLLLCMPIYLNSLRGCTSKCKKYWWAWGKSNNQQVRMVTAIRERCGRKYVFGDSLITRPYMDRQNIAYADRIFQNLKSLWDQKDILIVEGDQTRLGVGNDLFSNARSIHRILAPAVGAFDCYDRIKEVTLKNASGRIVILALGPTATVLAADLADHGVQALDLGHVDIEYEWYLHRQTTKTAVQGKFTNESVNGRNFTDCEDEKYQNQILKTISIRPNSDVRLE